MQEINKHKNEENTEEDMEKDMEEEEEKDDKEEDEHVLDNREQIESFEYFDCIHDECAIVEFYELTYTEEERAQVKNYVFPNSVNHIIFNAVEYKYLCDIKIPKSLKKLSINCCGESLKYITLPENLEYLYINPDYSDEKTKIIPEDIKIPESVKILVFGNNFEQSLNNIKLPVNLRKLSFNGKNLLDCNGDYETCYNKSLNGTQLPQNLEHLDMGCKYNQSFYGVKLPDSIKYLNLGSDYDQSLKNIELPKSLKTLNFGNSYARGFANVNFPDSLKTIIFGKLNCIIDNLPNTISKIKIEITYDYDQLELIKRVPFGCVVVDYHNRSLL